MDFYKKAKRIAEKLKDKKSLVFALSGMARLLIWRAKYKTALVYLKKALRIVDARDYLLKTNILNAISATYNYLGRYEKSLTEGKRAIRMARKSKIRPLELKIFHDLSVCYFNLGQFGQALYGFQKIINIERKNPTPLLACTYTYYGSALRTKGLYSEAKASLEKALELQKFFNHKRGILVTIKELGHLQLWTGDYTRARTYYEEALNLNIEMGVTDINLESLDGLTRLYLQQGAYGKAEESLNKLFLNRRAFGNANFMLTKALFESGTGYWNKTLRTLQRTLFLSRKSSNHLVEMLSLYYLSVFFHNKADEKKWLYYLRKSLRLYKKYPDYKYFLIRAVKQNPTLFVHALEKKIESHVIYFILQEIDKLYNLKVKFFGELEIRKGEEFIKEKNWKTQKAKSLFCYLTVHREQRFNRDKLIEIFWPNASFSAGRGSLRTAINFIRETIGDSSVIYEKETYSMNPDWKIWIDCVEFERMLNQAQELVQKGDEQGTIAKCKLAHAVYRGDFLPEVYDNWTEDRRQFYREKYLGALTRIANYCYMKGDFKNAIDNCGKIIKKDKLQEEAYYLLIQCYLKIRNRKRALNIYKQLCRLLRENFQSEPRQEIKELIEN